MSDNSLPQGPVVVDLRPLQTPKSRGRGVHRYAFEFTAALERHRPDLVSRYLLAPDWPPPADMSALLATGKVAYSGDSGWLPDCARVYHSLSPFELSVPASSIRPAEIDHNGLSFSATVYDLIPLTHQSLYLTDAAHLRPYRARAEMLRLSDHLLAVSDSTKSDCLEVLGLEPEQISVVGFGRPRYLGRAADPLGAGDPDLARRLVPGLAEHFVLCLGGGDSRKNVDRLIVAFAGLPGRVRATRQLVIYGDVPDHDCNRFRQLAESAGTGDQLLIAGYVPDRALGALYHSAEVVCFPSLAEGCSLAVAEAMACGAVVLSSDLRPFDQVVRAESRFDPTDAVSIGRSLNRALTDQSFRKSSRRHAESGSWATPWEEVVEDAAKIFERLASRHRRPWRRGPRIAFVSPFPPLASGIAAYSDKLAMALRAHVALVSPHAELDLFADGRDRDAAPPADPAAGAPEWFDARQMREVEGALGGYDRVVYVLGNSEYHSGALAALRRRSGIVIAHDVRLTNLLRLSTGTPGAVPGGLEGSIRRAYGNRLPDSLGRHDELTAADIERFGLLMMRDIVPHAEVVLVSSEAARRLACADVGPEYASRIGVLPFAMALTAAELEVVDSARASAFDSRALVASFGIVDPTKRPQVLIAALADSPALDAELAFVGPCSDSLRAELGDLASSLGVADRVTVTGRVSRDDYLGNLGRATVGVQLRSGFGGEASAAVADCLAAGVPSVVSDIGWMGELPATVVRKVAVAAGPDELAASIEGLVGRADRRERLSAAARAFAAEHTFEATAAALAAILALD